LAQSRLEVAHFLVVALLTALLGLLELLEAVFSLLDLVETGLGYRLGRLQLVVYL